MALAGEVTDPSRVRTETVQLGPVDVYIAHPTAPGPRVEPTRSRHVAIIRTLEDLQPCVDPLGCRPTLVQPLELLGGPRNRREPP